MNKTLDKRIQHVAILDPNPDILDYIGKILTDRYKVSLFSEVDEFCHSMEQGIAPDLLMMDWHACDPESGNGSAALLGSIRSARPAMPVVVLACSTDLTELLAATRMGASEILLKPFRKCDIDAVVKQCLEAFPQSESGDDAKEIPLNENTSFVRSCRRMQVIESQCVLVARADIPVLILGESGTGKEVAARLIHERSGREGPFVAVNLGAVPEALLESELFGHEKGAFTGADARKAGLFETAHAGSIFLDEIGELPLHLQVKLLRAIQERKVQRLGGLQGIPIDARLIAATNRDLEAEVRAGRFREDLYYRINVIRLRMPPLREREGDRALLAGFFLKKLSAELGRKVEGISAAALGLIESHAFPGNVRELENAIERALILAEGPILEARDFQFFIPGASDGSVGSGPEAPASLAEIEARAIAAALARHGYHREKSAAELGITRRTLLNKIKEYGLEIPGSPQD